MIYAGILAAGAGRRMHRQDLPKPFLNLGSKPIIIHTLEQFYVNPQVERVIVVAHADWRLYAEDMINRYDMMGADVTVICGGVNKTVSIQMIAEYITDVIGAHDNDILLTHDAVRPFVTQRVIDANIKAAAAYGAASTVITTNDTIVVTKNGSTLWQVPPKGEMYAEQTPLTFKLKLLNEMFKKAKANGVLTDNETEIARLYISQGFEMRLTQGEYFNMKIINPYDLEVAAALLKERRL